MPFKKGERHPNQGGRAAGLKGGRPTKEAIAERESLREAVERELQERGSIWCSKYLNMAEQDPATMRHLIDRVIPPAKQTVAVEVGGELESAIKRLRERKEHK